jgi:hypothetical protein
VPLLGNLEFVVCASEVLLLAVRSLELSSQAGNAEHVSNSASEVVLLMHAMYMKLENLWQGEQAKCL